MSTLHIRHHGLNLTRLLINLQILSEASVYDEGVIRALAIILCSYIIIYTPSPNPDDSLRILKHNPYTFNILLHNWSASIRITQVIGRELALFQICKYLEMITNIKSRCTESSPARMSPCMLNVHKQHMTPDVFTPANRYRKNI